MKDLEAVVSMALFEAMNGLSRPTESCEAVKRYVEDNYIRIDSLGLDIIEQIPLSYATVVNSMLGVCFPVNAGRVSVRCERW